ncbi:MAG: hypothetical protein NTV06_05930, partial [candidate division Zixibacteria bacterium]|nr:hypothetical protein [candidate division Zixibacteria bacterium]
WNYVGIKPMLEMISILHKSIETLIIGLNGSLNLIIYVGLTLILIAIIDHKIAQTRQDMF